MQEKLKAIRQGLLILANLEGMTFEPETNSLEVVSLIKGSDTSDVLAKMSAHFMTRLNLWEASSLELWTLLFARFISTTFVRR